MATTLTHQLSILLGRSQRVALTVSLAAALLLATSDAKAQQAPVQPTPTGLLSISGMGAIPGGRVTMTLGPQAHITATANKSGSFTFTPIPYDFESDLPLSFAIPSSGATKKESFKNTLALKIRPTAFTVEAEGYATKAASIALNVGGQAAAAGVASNTAYFKVASPSRYSSMRPGSINVLASIINVKEECCPRTFSPAEPVTILVQNIAAAPTARTSAVGLVAPSSAAPVTPTASETPATPAATQKEPPKPGTPVGPRKRPTKDSVEPEKSGEVTSGEVIQTGSISTPTAAYASVDGTWVRGLRQVSTQVVQTIMLQARMIGGFIDAQVSLDAQRSLQKLHAQALKDYTPGDTLCKFGSLSKSLVASESRGIATKIAVNEIMEDRDSMRTQSMYATSVGDGEAGRVRQFSEKFCNRIDDANGLERFCTLSTDVTYNRDVDYTRVMDTPLTLGVNFLGGANAAQERANSEVLALSNNLYSNEPFKGFNFNEFEAGNVLTDDLQDYRSVIAARGVVRNSFASLVGMKAAGTGASTTYMRAIMTQMGLSAADADRLLGANPSYFAQMEVLTKKMYQDPRFFADLYDKPANVDRQRAAMRGINLTQQADLLDVLHRREMLLSVLLELKLQNLDEKKTK